MDQNSQSLLSDREKGERLREIFDTLNKMKKRLERLKATRSLSPAELKEHSEVAAKLGSFHEKCRSFIKTRKNGPGKFMVEEYLKWCSSQKSSHHRNNSQYKSSLEYVKNTYGQERHAYALDPDAGGSQQRRGSQRFSPGLHFSPTQPLEDDHPRAAFFRGMCPQQLGMHQRSLEQGYRMGMKHPEKRLDSHSSFASILGSRSDPSGSLRKSLGSIEPLQSQPEPLRSPAPHLQGMYYYASPPMGYPAKPPVGVGLQPITTVARRSNYSENSMDTANEQAMTQRISGTGSSRQFEPVHNAYSFGVRAVPSTQSGFAPRGDNAGLNLKHNSVASDPFIKNVMFPVVDAYAPSFDNGYPQDKPPMNPNFSRSPYAYKSPYAGSALPTSPNSLRLAQPMHPSLQYDQAHAILSQSADSRFETPIAKVRELKSPNTAGPDEDPRSAGMPFGGPVRANVPSHGFPFEFSFDNKILPNMGAYTSLSSDSYVPSILSDGRSVPVHAYLPASIKEAGKKGARLSFSQKLAPRHDLSGVKRAQLDDVIGKADPGLDLDPALRDCLLTHLDSVLHQAIMLSAAIASTRANRTICVDDICLGFWKAVKPEFSGCFGEKKQIEGDRDYTLHNRILELIESQEQ